jgi:hypothetical protein
LPLLLLKLEQYACFALLPPSFGGLLGKGNFGNVVVGISPKIQAQIWSNEYNDLGCLINTKFAKHSYSMVEPGLVLVTHVPENILCNVPCAGVGCKALPLAKTGW